MGLSVPTVYIVPAERFCREIGPALGINLCEFEFPAYFNYFVLQKQCSLIVDNKEDEHNIRKVFAETLIGPAQFRNHARPKANEEEDFDGSYPVLRRPNFYREFYHFRTAEASTNYEEFTIDTLLKFHLFSTKTAQASQPTKLGVPPPLPMDLLTKEILAQRTYDSDPEMDDSDVNEPKPKRSVSVRKRRGSVDDLFLQHRREGLIKMKETKSYLKVRNSDRSSMRSQTSDRTFMKSKSTASKPNRSSSNKISENSKNLADAPGFWGSAGSMMDTEEEEENGHGTRSKSALWTYSQAKWLGNVVTIYPTNATEEDKKTTKTARVEIFKMPGGLEYIAHDIDENNHIIGKVRFSGSVHISDSLVVSGYNFTNEDMNHANYTMDGSYSGLSDIPRTIAPPTFHPPSFGVTVLGNSHGFDKSGSTSGYVLWINGRGVMIDPPPYSSATLEREGIRPQMIMAIIVTHCHADHDAGTFQKVMTGSRVAVITTPTIYKSFIRKYSALSGLSPALLRHSHRFRPAIIGRLLQFQGASFNFHYTLHTIPCIAFRVEWRGRSIVFTGDHLNEPTMIDRLEGEVCVIFISC